MRGVPLALLAAVAACDEFAAAVDDVVDAPPQAEIEGPAPAAVDERRPPSAEERELWKVTRYAECLVRTRPQVEASEAKWRATVGEDGKPIKRRTVPEIDDVDDIRTTCEVVDAEGPTTPPELPDLEGAVSTYVDALRQVGQHTKTLAAYYAQQAYEDDEWAKGVELAPTMDAAFGRFASAADDLATKVATHQAALDEVLLPRADPEGLEWACRSAMVAARAWVGCIEPLTRPRPDDSEDPATLKACDAALGELAAADGVLALRRRADPAAADEVFWLTAYAHSTERLRREAELLHAGPDDEPRRRKPEPPRDPSPALAAYRELVLDYGHLRFPR